MGEEQGTCTSINVPAKVSFQAKESQMYRMYKISTEGKRHEKVDNTWRQMEGKKNISQSKGSHRWGLGP